MNSPAFNVPLTADQLDAVCEGLGARLEEIDAAPRDYEPGYRDMVAALLADLVAVRHPRR